MDADTIINKCLNCGKKFKPWKNKRYCRQLCYQRHKRFEKSLIRKPKKINCLVCDKEFIPSSVRNFLCSDGCRSAHKREYHAMLSEKKRKRREAQILKKTPCRFCKKIFVVTRPNRVFCSTKCRNNSYYHEFRKPQLEWIPTLREVTDYDIKNSKFSEEIKAFKKSGKKIISFPQLTPIKIDDLGVETDKFEEDLSYIQNHLKDKL